MHVGHAWTLIGAKICDVLQIENRRARSPLCLDLKKIGVTYVYENKSRPEIFLQVADLDVVQLNSLRMTDKETVGRDLAKH